MGPTKAQELATWAAFVAAQPEGSYLASYLEGSEAALEREMSNDMHCELLSVIRDNRNYASSLTLEYEHRAEKLRLVVRDLEAKQRSLESEIRWAASALKTVTSSALEVSSALGRADCAARLAVGELDKKAGR